MKIKAPAKKAPAKKAPAKKAPAKKAPAKKAPAKKAPAKKAPVKIEIIKPSFYISNDLDLSYKLFQSVKKGDLKMVKYYIDIGADPNEQFEIGDYDIDSISLAASKGYLNIVKYIVESGADFEAHDDEPINFALQNGHIDVYNYLMKKKSN